MAQVTFCWLYKTSPPQTCSFDLQKYLISLTGQQSPLFDQYQDILRHTDVNNLRKVAPQLCPGEDRPPQPNDRKQGRIQELRLGGHPLLPLPSHFFPFPSPALDVGRLKSSQGDGGAL